MCKECRANDTEQKLRHREQSKQYYHAHREERAACRKRYNAEHPEWYREYHAKYRAEHRDRVNELVRQWSLKPENAERKRQLHRINRERERVQYHDWQQRNKTKVASYSANRRVLKAGNGGDFTALEWDAMKRHYKYRCLCCGRQEPEIKLHADHVIPISKGGSGYISNIQPLCASCNESKGTKIIDYRPDQFGLTLGGEHHQQLIFPF